jgi:GPN-loop GTPase
VSSVTGAGVKEFFEAVEASREEYERDYLPDLQRARKRKEETLAAAKKDSMDRLLNDLAIDREKDPGFAARDKWDAEDDDDEDQDDSDINFVDRSKWCPRPTVKNRAHN